MKRKIVFIALLLIGSGLATAATADEQVCRRFQVLCGELCGGQVAQYWCDEGSQAGICL